MVHRCGMSTHGLQWYSQCVNDASLDALAYDWGASVMRISMYVQENGYETDPAGFTDRVSSIIDKVTARGMYAIVDWHLLDPGDPYYNLSRAKTFFSEIARRHGTKTNLLYEIANEPSDVSWSRIRSYAEELIPVIRAIDPETPILVGTRAWSSLGVSDGADGSEVVGNPVRASNIMYTFHFYAASHDDEYLNALSGAADRIPMFITEFGTQEYTGDGPTTSRWRSGTWTWPRGRGAAGRTGTSPTTSAAVPRSPRAPARTARSRAPPGSSRPAGGCATGSDEPCGRARLGVHWEACLCKVSTSRARPSGLASRSRSTRVPAAPGAPRCTACPW
jgi:hypothetical protein